MITCMHYAHIQIDLKYIQSLHWGLLHKTEMRPNVFLVNTAFFFMKAVLTAVSVWKLYLFFQEHSPTADNMLL